MCKLIKSLYVLKQAPKQWHAKFDQTSNGFKINECDKCVYIKDSPNKEVIVCWYLDENSIMINDIANIRATKHMLSIMFDMKDLGVVDVILGIKILKILNGVALSQTHYFQKVLEKFKYFNFKRGKTPLM